MFVFLLKPPLMLIKIKKPLEVDLQNRDYSIYWFYAILSLVWPYFAGVHLNKKNDLFLEIDIRDINDDVYIAFNYLCKNILQKLELIFIFIIKSTHLSRIPFRVQMLTCNSSLNYLKMFFKYLYIQILLYFFMTHLQCLMIHRTRLFDRSWHIKHMGGCNNVRINGK